jgi:hypothetical protein
MLAAHVGEGMSFYSFEYAVPVYESQGSLGGMISFAMCSD